MNCLIPSFEAPLLKYFIVDRYRLLASIPRFWQLNPVLSTRQIISDTYRLSCILVVSQGLC